MVIETEVWCIADGKQHEMGMDGGNAWYPIVIDFREVTYVKLVGEHEFIGDDKTDLVVQGHHLTVNIVFRDAVRMFKQSRGIV